jgi:hypothetical protein
MGNKKHQKSISRRGFIPLVGASMFMPFFSKSAPRITHGTPKEDEEFATLLTPGGEVVKVRRTALKKAKVLEKSMTNKSLLNWLKPKKGNNR